MRGPTRPALASPSKSTVLRYSHSWEVAVSFFDGRACRQHVRVKLDSPVLHLPTS